MFALNKALLFKWIWRFISHKDSLWTKVISVIHGVDGRIGKGHKSGHSSIWLRVVSEFDRMGTQGMDFYCHMTKKIGNGSNTLFWEDIWRGDKKLMHKFPRLYALENNKRVDVASKLAQDCLDSSFRRLPRGGCEAHQFCSLKMLLEGVLLNDSCDRWSWGLSSSGEFSVASIRKAIDDKRLPNVSSKTRWVKEVPIKVNILAWKVKMDGLPTRLKLSYRGLDINSILCPVCGIAVESSRHLFFECFLARDNLHKVCQWWDINFRELHSFEDWSDWLLYLSLPGKHKRLLEGVCFGLWWLIWSFRNNLIFGADDPSKATIFDDLVLFSFYWSRYRCNVSFSWVDWLKYLRLVSLF